MAFITEDFARRPGIFTIPTPAKNRSGIPDALLWPSRFRKGLDQAITSWCFSQREHEKVRELGADVGVDSVGDWSQAQSLGTYLGRLEEENALPKVVLYNLNPADNYVLATMIGNFQDGSTPGKIQFGSGWWFLD
ncbi:MAG: D-glucuronate isomerase [Candidatus Angelobacter sp.]|jgi:glucuronate isomerase|nr:D-glucuronate isomerase [Candidatus Angelobacter sp.]